MQEAHEVQEKNPFRRSKKKPGGEKVKDKEDQEKASKLVVSAGHEPAADIPPVISPESKERIHQLIQSAEDQGASLLLDGRKVTVPDYPNGNFVGPTIINNMNQSMEAYQKEIFGPVLCVLAVDTLEEAIELVNRSEV